MSRMPLTAVDRQPEPIREFMDRRGDLNVFRMLAHDPTVFIGWSQWVDELLDSPTFTVLLRELVTLRVAYLQKSPYELSQHLGLARAAGATEAQIDAVTGQGGVDEAGFDSTERIVLDLTTELCTTRHLSENTFNAAQVVLGDEAVAELLMIISCYYGLALVLNATGLDADTTTRLQLGEERDQT